MVGGLQGTNNKYGLCYLQLTGSIIISFSFINKHVSSQSLAGLGSDKNEEEMSYQEKKALEKKRSGEKIH